MLDRWIKGRAAESRACRYLKKRGLRILARNHREGRGELDIIARDKNELCIVEVRSRGKNSTFIPEESMTASKIRSLSRTTAKLIRKHRLDHVTVRIDLLVVDLETDEIRFYPGGISPPARS